eukprot:TRINITY_DN1683_c0_g1_i3.p1 TRINITY_DN1683_c0_g1~~TRINITY_DN1683_c0_g1_i3.p1  ORF type:complete len:233 (-),score=44.83 TRINITY_DN1683_c0_g1_i3:53-751(-)
MLYSMFSGRWQLEPDEDGRIFIDRNGEYFQDILDYLRDGHLVEPRNERHRKALVREAEYYRLPGLLKHLEVLGPTKEPENLSWTWDPENCCKRAIKISSDGKNATRQPLTDHLRSVAFPAVYGKQLVKKNYTYQVKVTRQYSNSNQYVMFGIDNNTSKHEGRSSQAFEYIYQFEPANVSDILSFMILEEEMVFYLNGNQVFKKEMEHSSINAEGNLYYPIAVVGEFTIQILD